MGLRRCGGHGSLLVSVRHLLVASTLLLGQRTFLTSTLSTTTQATALTMMQQQQQPPQLVSASLQASLPDLFDTTLLTRLNFDATSPILNGLTGAPVASMVHEAEDSQTLRQVLLATINNNNTVSVAAASVCFVVRRPG